MTGTLPAVGLVALGVGVVGLGLGLSGSVEPTNSGEIASLLTPALETLAVSCLVGIGVVQMLGGATLLATAGWS